MINIAICDDEKVFGEKLAYLVSENLKRRGETFRIDRFSSGKELIALGSDIIQYNMIFLDINMEELDGIKTAKMIRALSDEICIIFVTAFIKYTLEGYKVNALRYLVKTAPNFTDCLEECMDAFFKKMKIITDKKTYRFVEGELPFLTRKLVYIESRLHKLDFHIKGQGMQVYHLQRTLNQVEKDFDNGMFVRIHQSYLVNLAYVETIEKDNIILRDGEKLPISRSQYKNVYNTVMRYKGGV